MLLHRIHETKAATEVIHPLARAVYSLPGHCSVKEGIPPFLLFQQQTYTESKCVLCNNSLSLLLIYTVYIFVPIVIMQTVKKELA